MFSQRRVLPLFTIGLVILVLQQAMREKMQEPDFAFLLLS